MCQFQSPNLSFTPFSLVTIRLLYKTVTLFLLCRYIYSYHFLNSTCKQCYNLSFSIRLLVFLTGHIRLSCEPWPCLLSHLEQLPRCPETQVDSPGVTLIICHQMEMATHSSVLAWRIPGMGEPGGLPSMGSHRIGHD